MPDGRKGASPPCMHFGIISPPVPGHINPFGALGRELIGRGHRVTFLHMPDLEERVRAQGLEFAAIGHTDHPSGSLPRSLKALGKLDGLAALRFTIQAVCKTTEMMCRDAPRAIRELGINMLLVDQTELAGGTVAEHLGLPFVTLCHALAMHREPGVPPPFTHWSYNDSPWARLRNRLGYRASDRFTAPIGRVVAAYRQQWGLPPHHGPEDSFSPLGQISQQPPAFDFPRRKLPPTFHYAGPFRGSSPAVPFPWERLDGRPLIYASLGTLQNRKERIFRCFAQACDGLPAQLLITHGGALDDGALAGLPGAPLVVSYAPQLEVLSRAHLTLTHAGLNTVLDSLTHGVPLVAVPITYEQPAIAARILWTGSGEVLPLKQLNPAALRDAIVRVLGTPRYRENAGVVAESIRQAGGVRSAADTIERLAAQVP